MSVQQAALADFALWDHDCQNSALALAMYVRQEDCPLMAHNEHGLLHTPRR